MNDLPGERQILTISQLNRRTRQLLETHFSLLWVRGEISNLACPRSGHWYFTLKDSDAQIRCAMFRNRNQLVSRQPKDGDQVLVRGRVSLYENRGDYQLIAEHLEPDGLGRLQQAYEMLRDKLAAEGLFAPERKRETPEYPARIGVITSPSGAAVRDILHVLARRAPWIPVTLYPTPVQGSEAPGKLIEALQIAADDGRCDVLILSRGGGSLEDLWAFNDERLARAIADCPIPVVVGVGHETDFTIADFVADHRAPTPSAAAEHTSPDMSHLKGDIDYFVEALQSAMGRQVRQWRQHLDGLRKRLRNPGDRLRDQAQHLDHLEIRLKGALNARLTDGRSRLRQAQARFAGLSPSRQVAMKQLQLHNLSARLNSLQRQRLTDYRKQLQGLASTLNAVSPLATLDRGYAIALDQQHRVVRSVEAVNIDDPLEVRLGDGQLRCRVTGKSDTGRR
ncbi:MAG: exodeoxyribonuclease VII large subunit [Porticoccaceae bacterium]|nr:exodeoxyribonuclease VII large subunit [Porticoccaceae bacterium]